MAITHRDIALYDNDTSNVIMYFPITTTVERIGMNDIFEATRPWGNGGSIAVDKKLWKIELVIQGTFVSTDIPVDPDFVTDLRAIPGVPAAWAVGTITAEQQYDWLFEQLLTIDEFRLDYLDASYRYATGSGYRRW